MIHVVCHVEVPLVAYHRDQNIAFDPRKARYN